MTGGGVIALPLLLIFGFYSFSRPWLKGLCVAGVLVWGGGFLVSAIEEMEWRTLTFPAIVCLGWMALHPLLKDA